MQIARIDDEILTADDFVKILKLDNRFNTLIEQILIDKLTVRAAKQSGITVTPAEIQERVDQFRRVEGLHRAQDTHAFLEALGVTLDEFENHMTEILYREKMRAQITRQEQIDDYFRLHSPKFDSVEINHITVDSDGKARELLALLEDEPTLFAELAREHSLDLDSKFKGVTWARCCGGVAQRGGSQDLQRRGRGTAGSLRLRRRIDLRDLSDQGQTYRPTRRSHHPRRRQDDP